MSNSGQVRVGVIMWKGSDCPPIHAVPHDALGTLVLAGLKMGDKPAALPVKDW